MDTDEALLVEKTRQGDSRAYERLVRTHQARLVAFLGNLLGSIDDGRDVAQEVFIQAFIKLNEFAPGRSFKAWLFAIAYHRGVDWLRKKRRFRRFWDQASVVARPPRDGKGIEPTLLWQSLLQPMTPQERSVLALKYSEGCDTGEIAAALGCSESTVRVHLLNARRKLKKQLPAAGFKAGAERPGAKEAL